MTSTKDLSASDPSTLDDVLDREAALRDVLNVIRDCRDDEAPVFDTILGHARTLCDAPFAALVLAQPGDAVQRLAAHHGNRQSTIDFYAKGAVPMDPAQSFAARAMMEQRVIHLPDMSDTDEYRAGIPSIQTLADKEGIRTNLFVPLVADGAGIGCFILFRHDVRPFSDAQIGLVEAFAAQAVIAIENVRQFRELQTRLEREQASREILQVISQSREDERPVFDAILQNASRLCHAPLAFLPMADETRKRVTVPAFLGVRADFASALAEFSEPLEGSQLVAVRAIAEARVIRSANIIDDPEFPATGRWRSELTETEGARSVLLVPLRKAKMAIGAIMLYRREISPFTDDEVALVETFAAQAVIAIENVRQFREVQVRLEREKASSEILDVISQSRDDEAPVFEAILRLAASLCNAPMAWLLLLSEDRTRIHLAAHYGLSRRKLEIGQTWPATLSSWQTGLGEALVNGRVAQEEDLSQASSYLAGEPDIVQLVDDEGLRTRVSVPLMRNGQCIGVIVLTRRQVELFGDSEIELVETFAAQAVIAIENVRQYRELQNRLEREKATTDVLGVISRSRDDDLPVFNTILENAAQLSGAPLANLCLTNEARTHWRLVAHHGEGLRHLTAGETVTPLNSNLVPGVTMRTAKVVHIEDLTDTDLYKSGDEGRVAMVEKEGMRTILGVPLLSGDVAIGCITLFRREVKAFTPDEIALVETFAAQAVIAIENVRQFREVQERLEREKASGEVLEIISQSRDDDLPVFQSITRSVAQLCRAPLAYVCILNQERTHVTIPAQTGARPEFAERLARFREPVENDWLLAIDATLKRKVIRVDDLAQSELYREGNEYRVNMVDEEGMRSVLAVPLIHGDDGVGCIFLYRREVAPFTDAEVELVRSFAAQAVIAIENVRQYRALEALNAELEGRVADQVDEIERMGRLKRFLSPAVADAVVTSGDESLLNSHRALIATLFCDIRGFTAFCERAEPEETIEILQTYHEAMGRLIADHGAGVDTRAGDGIMVLFNDPMPCDDPAGDALRLALAMRDRMSELCADWRKLGHRLGFGCGISLGYATVGIVGSSGRFDYTASGTTVNLAARLCDQAQDGEILLSPRAFRAVEDQVIADPAGELTLKGIAEPVDVMRVSGFG